MNKIYLFRTIEFGVGRDRAAYQTLKTLPEVDGIPVYLAHHDGSIWCHACICKHDVPESPKVARLNFTVDLICSSCGIPIKPDYQGDIKW